MLKMIKDDPPWYAQGLRFECTGCGQCCTGAPGYVWVNEEEIQHLADFLQLSKEEFSRSYLRQVKGKTSLIELPQTYDCVFLKDKKCQVYSARPIQCRTYPWWSRHLKTEQDWQEAAQYCEGIHAQAPVTPLEVIEKQRAIQESIFHEI